MKPKMFLLILCICIFLLPKSVLADITISSCDYDTNISDTYVLSSNLTCGAGANGVVIDIANIVLDCGLNTITGNGDTTSLGVYISTGHIKIQNCSITNFGYGIQSDGNYTNITSSNIYSNLVNGIYLTKGASTIFRNYIYDQSGTNDVGIYLSDNNNTIINNTLNNNDIGILFTGSSNNTVSDTYISSVTKDIQAQSASINNIVLNTTLAKGTNSIAAGTYILRQWKGIFIVNRTTGSGIGGATINLTSTTGKKYNLTTNIDGVAHINLTAYNESLGLTFETPYTINISTPNFKHDFSLNFTDNFVQVSTDNCSYYGGNWNITAHTECRVTSENINLTQDANISVYGKLTLRGVNLRMNVTYNNAPEVPAGIYVYAGANLTIEDNNGVPTNITTVAKDGTNFAFIVYDGANFSMRNSALSYSGYDQQLNAPSNIADGLYINSTNITIIGNTFTNNRIGLYLVSKSYRNNIKDNQFHSNTRGIQLYSANNSLLENITGNSNTYDIYFVSTINTIIMDSVFTNAGTSNFYMQNSNNTLLNSTFSAAAFDTGSQLIVQYYVEFNVTNSSGDTIKNVDLTILNNSRGPILSQSTNSTERLNITTYVWTNPGTGNQKDKKYPIILNFTQFTQATKTYTRYNWSAYTYSINQSITGNDKILLSLREEDVINASNQTVIGMNEINITTKFPAATITVQTYGVNDTICSLCNETTAPLIYGNYNITIFANTTTGYTYWETIPVNVTTASTTKPEPQNLTQFPAYTNTEIKVSLIINGTDDYYNATFEWYNATYASSLTWIKVWTQTISNCRIGKCTTTTNTTMNTAFEKNQNWTVRGRACSGQYGCSHWRNLTETIPINNSAPLHNGSPSIAPIAPTTSDNLLCNNASLIDSDTQDTLTLFYDWLNSTDGSTYTSTQISNKTLFKNNLTTNAYWKCRLWVSDGDANSTNQTSNSVKIDAVNTAPIMDSGNASTNGIKSTSTHPTNNNTQINFQLNFSDADSDAAKLYVCKTADFEISGGCLNGEWCSQTTNTAPGPITCAATNLTNLTNQQYNWYAYINSTTNNFVSSVRQGTFEINHPPSGTPTITSNNDGTIYPGTQRAVTISWSEVTDPDNDDVDYIVYGGTTSPPNAILVNQTLTNYPWGISTGTTNYWRAATFDEHSFFGENSTTYSFFVSLLESQLGGSSEPPTIIEPLTEEQETLLEQLQAITLCGDSVCEGGEFLTCSEDCIKFTLEDLLCIPNIVQLGERCMVQESGFLTAMFALVILGFIIVARKATRKQRLKKYV